MPVKKKGGKKKIDCGNFVSSRAKPKEGAGIPILVWRRRGG